MQIEPIVVPDEMSGVLLDEFVSLQKPRVAKGTLRRLIRDGLVTVDGIDALPNARLRAGQIVMLEFDEGDLREVPRTHLDIQLLYADEQIWAVDKPAGVPVEPGRWGEHPITVTGAALDRAQAEAVARGELGVRPRALHRLDLGTSGVVLYALTLEAERHFRAQFDERRVEKLYHALVIGELDGPGSVDLRIGPGKSPGRPMVADEVHGKPSLTDYAPLKRFRGYTLVEARPKTGRTHQIRVHMAAIGHPLVVDPRYGGRPCLKLSELKPGYRQKAGREERPLIDRLTLHAHTIALDGLDGERIEIEAPYPKDFRVALAKLERWRGR